MTRQHKRQRTDVDPDGTERTLTWRPPNQGAKVTSIPEEWRLLHLYCPNPRPNRHGMAVVSPNGEGELLILVQSPNLKPTAQYMLTGDGQLDAVVSMHIGEEVRIAGVGDPQPEVHIRCVRCRPPADVYLLDAEAVVRAGAEGRTGLTLRRAEPA